MLSWVEHEYFPIILGSGFVINYIASIEPAVFLFLIFPSLLLGMRLFIHVLMSLSLGAIDRSEMYMCSIAWPACVIKPEQNRYKMR